MKHKRRSAFEIKAAGPDGGLAEGQFLAYASVFGNVDSYGDVVVKGAFAEDVAAIQGGDRKLAVLWGHRMDDGQFRIGRVLEATEDDHGLLVKGELFIDRDGPRGQNARDAYDDMKEGLVDQLSFAYDVEEAGWVKDGDDEYYELRKLKIYEVSLVHIGANQETEVLAVKHPRETQHALDLARLVASKAGRVLSSKNESALKDALAQLNEAAAGIQEVLSALDDREQEEDQEKAADDGPATAEEPSGAKAKEPTRPSPAQISALLDIALADAS